MTIEMPSIPQSRDEAFGTVLRLLDLVSDLDLRDALRWATIDYAHAAATEALHGVRALIEKSSAS